MPATDAETHERWRLSFLRIYEQNLCVQSELFPGMSHLLEVIEKSQRSWGVVTNKPGWLAEPLLETLGLTQRMACMIPGDALARRKPHPDPILRACELTGASPLESIYVGDAERDIQAGRNAGMPTVAAVYGYILPEENPADWQANHQIDHPSELLELINSL